MSKTYHSDKLGAVTIPEPDKPAQGHTPGPWWTVGSSQTSILQGDKHDPQIVATTETGDIMNVESYAECIANARLIASAPDLLAACKEADALLNDTTAVRKILRAAIAKAEGRAE